MEASNRTGERPSRSRRGTPRRSADRPRRSTSPDAAAAPTASATMANARRVSRAPIKAPPARRTKRATKPLTDIAAGALARVASQGTIHPIDSLKVRAQAGASTGGWSKFSKLVPPAGCTDLGAHSRYVFGKAIPKVATLYKGVWGAASGAGVAIGAYFACYGVAHNALANALPDLSPGATALYAGGIAAAGSSIVKVPIAVCVRSVQAGIYPDALSAGHAIVKRGGPSGLFCGFVPTVLEDIPDMAFKFAAYESLRLVHQRLIGDRRATPAEDFAIGAASGAFAAAATTPLDVIKTNMMVSAGGERLGMIQAARKVHAASGLRGFAAGVGPRAISNGINSAVFFCFFEALSRAFKKQTAEAAARRALRAESERLSQRPARGRASPVLARVAARLGGGAVDDAIFSRDELALQPASISQGVAKTLLSSSETLN